MKDIAYPFKGASRGELPHGDHTVLEPGEFGRWGSDWYARTPTGLSADLRQHMVVEHDDGTITVRPSIEVRGYAPETGATYFHGFLTKGVWTLDQPK